jgi:hypothetical protein
LRTSSTTRPAARPTARIASAENMNATEPPISSPINTCGWSMRMSAASTAMPASISACLKEPNRLVAAITAVAMATPLVIALVVLPTASSWVSTALPRSLSSPDISAIPWALSEIGPKVSIETITPTVVSMPMPIRETRNSL